MPKFIPGLQLSRMFFEQEVKPILHIHFPNLKYSAALIGWGSEVLGYDTDQSTDHHWGPRVLLFLNESDYEYKRPIAQKLSDMLPLVFKGYSTNFSKAEKNGVRHMVYKKSGKVNHMVDIFTFQSFFKMRLGIDASKTLTTADWLTMPQDRLLETTSGDVFHDDLGFKKIISTLKYYPHDVWSYLLASQWAKISEEEAFVGRTGVVGDELGSQVVAARLVREIMRLCFLMEKKYIAYSKWFGTAFKQLRSAKYFSPILHKVLLSKNWKERERYLSRAYSKIAKMHNDLKITKPLPTKPTKYYGRPYLVIHSDIFSAKIREKIINKKIKNLKLIGSVDQFTDSTPVSENIALAKKLIIIYS